MKRYMQEGPTTFTQMSEDKRFQVPMITITQIEQRGLEVTTQTLHGFGVSTNHEDLAEAFVKFVCAQATGHVLSRDEVERIRLTVFPEKEDINAMKKVISKIYERSRK